MNSYDLNFQPLTVNVRSTSVDSSSPAEENYVPLKVVMKRLDKQPKSVTTTPVDFGIVEQGDRKTLTIQVRNPNIQSVLSSQDKLGTSWVILDDNDTRILGPEEQQAIQVIVDTGSLVAGCYTATLLLTAEANDGDLSAIVHVPVLLTVSSVPDRDTEVQPILTGSLLKTSLSFVQFLSSSQSLPLTIHNWDAKNAVKWRAYTGGERWLILDRYEGILESSEKQTIWVTANSSPLQFGDYTTTLTIIPEGNQPPTQYQVELAVDAIPDGDNGPKAPIANPDHFDLNNLQSVVVKELYITNPQDQNPPNVILTIGNSLPTPPWLTWNIDQPGVPLKPGDTRTVHLTINKSGLRPPGPYTFELKPTFQFAPPAPSGSHSTSTSPPVSVTLAIP